MAHGLRGQDSPCTTTSIFICRPHQMWRSTQRSFGRCGRNSLTNRPDIRNWLFKSLAVEQSLERIENEGIAVRPASSPSSVQRLVPLEDFTPAVRQSAMRAMPAYLAFFCLENSVRELVS